MAKFNRARLIYQKDYDAMSRQIGKMDTKFQGVLEATDLDEAIKLARSMRGDVAVILKRLHKLKRKINSPSQWFKSACK